MNLSREVWREATRRLAEDPSRPVPVANYMHDMGGPCIAITGTLADYMAFIEALAWVQYGSRPGLALQEVRLLIERTAPQEGHIQAETIGWYLPSIRVTVEVY